MGKSRKETFETVENYDAEGNLIVTSEYGDIVATEEASDVIDENVDNDTLKRIKKKAVKRRKIRKALRRSHLRRLKNFFWWVTGVLSSFAVLATSIFIAVGVIPVGTFMGDNKEDYFTEEVSDKALLSLILNYEDLTFENFPFIEKKLGEVLDNDSGISAFVEYQALRVQPTLDANYKLIENAEEAKNYYAEKLGPVPFATTSDKNKYEKAFGDDGSLKAQFRESYDSGTLTLFLAPLFEKPIVEGLLSLGTYLDYVKVTDVLKIAGLEEVDLVYKLMEGIYVGDFANPIAEGGFSAEMILKNATLEMIGGASILRGLGNFSFFNGYDKVNIEDYPEVENISGVQYITKKEAEKGEDAEFTSNPLQYYIELVAPLENNSGEYVRAFDDDGKFISKYSKADGTSVNYDNLDAVKTEEKLCYANLSETPFTSAMDLIGESIFRQDILTLLESFGMRVEDDSIIKEVFEGQSIESFGKSPDEGGFDFEAIKLSAMLGEYEENKDLFDTLLAISGEKPVKEESETPEEYDQRIKAAAEELTVSSLTDGFNMDTVKIDDIITDLDEKTLDLLCSSINVSKEEEFNANPENIGVSYEPVTKETLSVGDFSYFKVDNIKLSDVVKYEENETLYEILLSANGLMPERVAGESDDAYSLKVKAEAEKLTTSQLDGLETNNVLLSSVLPYKDEDGNPINDKLYAILRDASTVEKLPGETDEQINAKITVGNLNGLQTDNIKLTTVLPDKDEDGNPINDKLYAILRDASTVEKLSGDTDDVINAKITVGNLNGLDTNAIRLSSVGITEDSGTIYEIIIQAIGENPKVGDLVGADGYREFTTDNIKLTTVLPDEDDDGNSQNEKLYEILRDATSNVNNDGITISSFSAFDVGKIKLETVDIDTKSDIYKILESALVEKSAGGITLGDLTRDVDTDNDGETDTANFQINNISLSAVGIDSTSGLIYEILNQATGEPNPTIGNLTNGFSLDNVSFNTIFKEDTGNAIIDELRTDGNVKISNLGDKINALDLSVLYDGNVFVKSGAAGEEYTKIVLEKTSSDVKTYFALTNGGITIPEVGAEIGEYTVTSVDGGYKINDGASIWLFMVYEYGEDIDGTVFAEEEKFDTNGNAKVYNEKPITIGGLSDGLTSVSTSIMNAKVQQLVDSGVLTDVSGEVLKMTIMEMIDFVNEYSHLIG